MVFDLDGTLIDSLADIAGAINAVLAGHSRAPLAIGAVKAMVGDGSRKLVERAFRAHGDALGRERLDAMTARFLDIYQDRGIRLTRPYPGARETLSALQARGYALGLCTNKYQAPTLTVLQDLGMDGYFAAILGGDALGGVRKPDPRHLLATLEALGAAAHQGVMVGDNENDAGAARAAGVPLVAVDFGYARAPVASFGAAAVIASLGELPAALLALS